MTYAHPLLEPILRVTLGVILCQEQIIETVWVVLNTKPAENATKPNGLKTVWMAAGGSVSRLPSSPQGVGKDSRVPWG